MKTLILYAHPGQQHSNANSDLVKATQTVEGVTFVDLYHRYPRHDIDVQREQQQLLDHDVIVFQFPLMWYSTPSILKDWQDLVLEHGFAYGQGGEQLMGKYWLNAVTAGAPQPAYTAEGQNKHTLPEMLTPLQATARLCHMQYLPPYVLYGALKPDSQAERTAHAEGYKALLSSLSQDQFGLEAAQSVPEISANSLTALIKGAVS